MATKDGLVTVLGTQFNVENRKGFFEVSCYEGLVIDTFNDKETKLHAANSLMPIKANDITTESPENGIPTRMSHETTYNRIHQK